MRVLSIILVVSMLSSVVLGAGQARFASEYDEMTEVSTQAK